MLHFDFTCTGMDLFSQGLVYKNDLIDTHPPAIALWRRKSAVKPDGALSSIVRTETCEYDPPQRDEDILREIGANLDDPIDLLATLPLVALASRVALQKHLAALRRARRADTFQI